MRLISQAAGRPSAWSKLKEVVGEGPVVPPAASEPEQIEAPPTPASEPEGSATIEEPDNSDPAAEEVPDDGAKTDNPQDAPSEEASAANTDITDKATAEDIGASASVDTPAGDTGASATADVANETAEAPAGEELPVEVVTAAAEPNAGELAENDADALKPTAKVEAGAVAQKDQDDAEEPASEPAEVPEKPFSKSVEDPEKSVEAEDASNTTKGESAQTGEDASPATTSVKDATVATNVKPSTGTAGAKARVRASSVGNKQATTPLSKKPGPSKFQVSGIPTRAVKDTKPAPAPATTTVAAAKIASPKPPSALELELARLDKVEKLEMMKRDKEIMAETRDHQRKLQLQAREQEDKRRAEDQKEQAEIRSEKRAYDKARRAAAQKAIGEAVAAKKDALTLDELNKIKAQNQFADRFDGIVNSDQAYAFDASGARGPSQTVTYSSRFIDKLTDITDDMAISGALSVKMAKFGGSGRGSFLDSNKFKQSDLNFYISVKVTNQTLNFKDALVFNGMRSVTIGSDKFNKVYGDSFISGFQEGGEFNAIISMKVHNKAKLLDIQAEAKVALTAGPVDVTAQANVGIARTNLEMNTETTIQVSWCGGGHIKPMEQPWNIQSVMQAAARFPSLVADCPQRTYAILTKYSSLRSYVSLSPAEHTPIQYESAQMYTGILMDAFMTYKSLYKDLGDQVSSIRGKTLQFEPWSDGDDRGSSLAIAEAGKRGTVSSTPAQSNALTAATDNSRFSASLEGLANARKFIRRQMIYIVNEVDLITKDPSVATQEDHEEPFQAPQLFETRLPATRIPDALKPKNDPLSGKRIMAKTQTEEELEKEREEQDVIDNASPALYKTDQDLSMDETSSLDAARNKSPMIGQHLQVSRAAPDNKNGDIFNNMDFLYPEWQVESITVGMTHSGCVGSVEVEYENGLILRKGLVSSHVPAYN